MATTWSRLCRAFTRRSLCSGETRANTLCFSATSGSSSSDSSSSSAPVIVEISSARASSRPMASAVPAWSPVIILTSMPALRHSLMASMASGRGGSTMPTMPWKVKPSPGSSPRLPSAARRAAARTRRPSAESSSMTPSQWARSRSAVASGLSASAWSAHRSRIRSGAPLRNTMSSPSGVVAWTAMYLLSELNGMSSVRRWPSASKSTLAASVTRAPSVGSPLMVQRWSSRLSSVSLATAMVVTKARRSAWSSRRISAPSSVTLPSGA